MSEGVGWGALMRCSQTTRQSFCAQKWLWTERALQNPVAVQALAGEERPLEVRIKFLGRELGRRLPSCLWVSQRVAQHRLVPSWVPEPGWEAWLSSCHLTPHRECTEMDLHRDGVSQLELAPEALSLHWLVIHNTAALRILVGRVFFFFPPKMRFMAGL